MCNKIALISIHLRNVIALHTHTQLYMRVCACTFTLKPNSKFASSSHLLPQPSQANRRTIDNSKECSLLQQSDFDGITLFANRNFLLRKKIDLASL